MVSVKVSPCSCCREGIATMLSTPCKPFPDAAVPVLGFVVRWMFGPGLSSALTPLVPQHSLRQLCASGQHEQGLACSAASKWSDAEHELKCCLEGYNKGEHRGNPSCPHSFLSCWKSSPQSLGCFGSCGLMSYFLHSVCTFSPGGECNSSTIHSI